MIERVEVPRSSLLTILSTFGFVDTWTLRIMIAAECDIHAFEESIHALLKSEWTLGFSIASTLAFENKQ
jgi:hypothetical protein